jgi:hypothetical protein
MRKCIRLHSSMRSFWLSRRTIRQAENRHPGACQAAEKMVKALYSSMMLRQVVEVR